MSGMTDADLFGAIPDAAPAGSLPDPAVLTVLGEAGADPEGQKAVASVIANRSKRTGATSLEIVGDPAQGFEAWTPEKRAKLQRQYPVGSDAYEQAKANVDPILSGKQPAPYGYDSFYSPTSQKALGRQPPAWEDGSGVDVAGNRFFTGKFAAPQILSDEDKAAWQQLQGNRPVEIASTEKTPMPGAPADSQADTAKFLALHGFFDKSAQPGSAQLPLMETAASGVPSTPGTWYIPRSGGLRQVGSDVPDYLPHYRALVATQGAEQAKPMLGRVAAGFGQGVLDVGGSINKLIGGVGASPEAALAGADYQDQIGAFDQATAQSYDNTRNRFNLVHGPDTAATLGRLGGNVVASAPLMAATDGALGALGGTAVRAAPELAPAAGFLAGRTGGNLLLRAPSLAARGGIQGAEAAGLTSAESDRPLPEQLAHGAEGGAILGTAIPLAAAGGNRLLASVAGHISPEVANLAQTAIDRYGIPLRRTQLLGVGDRGAAIRDSEMIGQSGTGFAGNNEAQHQAFSTAASHTIGENAPLTPDVMDAARRRIGGVFEASAQRNGATADGQLFSDLARVGSQARELGLDQSQINALDLQIAKITDQASRHGGVIPGDVYQTLTESGSSLSRIMKNDHSSFADLASDIRDALNGAVTRSASPEDVAALQQARFQWKNLKTLQPLAAKAGPDGAISPTLLRGRVMSQFPDFAFGGGGDLGDLARIGQTFMKEPPNSGTAPRLKNMLMGAIGGGAGVADLTLALHDPVTAAKLAGGAAAAAGLNYGKNAVSGAYNRSPSAVNALIRSGQQGPTPMPRYVGMGLDLLRPAYVPVGVDAERNKLLALPTP